MVGRRRRNFSHFLRDSSRMRIFRGREGGATIEGSSGRLGRATSRNLIHSTIYLREREKIVATRELDPSFSGVLYNLAFLTTSSSPSFSTCRLVTISLPLPRDVRHTFTRVLSSGDHKFSVLRQPPGVLPLWLFYDSRDNASMMIGKQCRRRTFDNSDG